MLTCPDAPMLLNQIILHIFLVFYIVVLVVVLSKLFKTPS